jgi:DNA-binding transcriptional LysR family regulator
MRAIRLAVTPVDEGLTIEPILREPYIALLPSRHKLAAKAAISPFELEDQQFVLFARKMGSLAYDRTVACCEAEGFRPNIVHDAPQWPTVLELVSAGWAYIWPPRVFAGSRQRAWSSISHKWSGLRHRAYRTGDGGRHARYWSRQTERPRFNPDKAKKQCRGASAQVGYPARRISSRITRRKVVSRDSCFRSMKLRKTSLMRVW